MKDSIDDKITLHTVRPHHLLLFLMAVYASSTLAGELTGADIVKQCAYKYAGEDQRSRLIIILTDRNGNAARSEYIRLWKNYAGKDGIEDKVILFTEQPPDSRGVNFMRWGYTNKSGKLAEQWVYLPELRMVRRVSKRDPKSMDWGFTDEELRIRDLSEDTHTLKGVVRLDDQDYYRVESVPHNDINYNKWISWFSKTDDMKDCVQRRVEYYDKRGTMIKQQELVWENIQGAWVWQAAVSFSPETGVSANYIMKDIEVNVGLTDDQFTERQLRRGYATH